MAIPAHLPREDVVVDLPEDEKRCPEGHALKEIGEDISEQLDVIPAQIKVLRTIRKKYAYFRHLLEKLPLAEKAEDIEALLPHRLTPQDIPALSCN